jgi:hypothetical protein
MLSTQPPLNPVSARRSKNVDIVCHPDMSSASEEARMSNRFPSARRVGQIVLVLLAVGLGVTVPARAQSGGDGVITGTVADSQGGALPGVSVTVRNVETGISRTAVTEGDGRYRVAALPPGRHELNAELSGFSPVRVKDLTLRIGLELRQDIKMSIESLQETVTVTGQAPVVETTKSDVSGIVTQDQIDTLPVNSRQTLQLSLLMPGTSEDATRPRKVNANVGAGGQFFSSAYLVDGVSNQEVSAGEPRQDFPQGAIREFKVNVSQASAEYGGSTGGVVTIVTKSGTNAYSGEVFEYFRDKSLNAMNKFEKQSNELLGLPKPPFRRNQYGASIGGPIAKDRVHFYVAADLTETNQSFTVNTGKPQFYSSVEGTFGNPQYRRMVFGRLDAQLNPQQTLFARWGYERDHNTYEGAGGIAAKYSNNTVEQRRHSLAVGHTWVVSSRALNEMRFQWAPFIYLTPPPGSPVWTDVGQFPPERFEGNSTVYNFPSLIYGASTNRVQKETWWEFRDNFSITGEWHGRHTLKLGAASVHSPDDEDSAFNTNGTWTFANDQPFNPNDPTTIANLKNPLLFVHTFPPVAVHLSDNWFQGYIQDDWRPVANLTLNLGVRYDVQYGTFNQHLKPTQFARPIPYIDPATRGDRNNVQPRAGFAWDVQNNGRAVVRGGYGLYNRYIWLAMGGFASEQNNLRQNIIIIRNPSYPDPYQGQNPLTFASTAPNINIVSDDLVNPIAHAVNLGLSKELGANLALHVDGVYTRTTKDTVTANINTVDPVTRVRPLAEWGQINEVQSTGEAKYTALMVRLEKRLARRYQYLASYTLAKSEDNLPYAGLAASTAVTDAYNPGLDLGPSRGDRRHALVTSAAVLLPGDVTLGTIWALRSSMTFSARAGRDINGDGIISDYVPGTSRNQGNRTLDLSLVNAWRGVNGLAPVSASQIDTNAYNSLDLRASKTFRLGGVRKLELIAQLFNVLGHDNLLPPASTSGWVENALSDSFGRILTANNRQQAEFAVRFVF